MRLQASNGLSNPTENWKVETGEFLGVCGSARLGCPAVNKRPRLKVQGDQHQNVIDLYLCAMAGTVVALCGTY